MSKYIFDWCPKYKRAIIKSDQLDAVRLAFSAENAAAKIRRNTSSFIPSRDHVITATGRFDLGLFFSIIELIRYNDDSCNIVLTKDLKQVISSTSVKIHKLPQLTLTPYYYQEKAVRQVLKYGRGNVIVGTGGGKTLMMGLICSSILKEKPDASIIIAALPNLVEQISTEFKQLGISPSQISTWDGKHKYKPCSINIASIKTLTSKTQDLTPVYNCDALLFDEVHTVKKKNKITKVIRKVKTHNKVGFTGTVPENKIDEWTMIGIFGPIVYEKPAHELRDEGFISNAVVRQMLIDHDDSKMIKPDYNNPTKAYHHELDFIIHNDKRNNLISNICNQYNNNILILVDRIEHGEKLQQFLIEKSPDASPPYFIQGSVSMDDREEIKSIMESSDNIVCIAMTKIFSTGISVKNIHHIVFASGGKGKTKIIQSIGRGVRLHENKSLLTVWDLVDQLKYGISHGKKRKLLYNQEKLKYTKHYV